VDSLKGTHEQLTKALQSAHMINGVSQEYAEELSLQVAVKSIITNSTIDKVRSVMKYKLQLCSSIVAQTQSDTRIQSYMLRNNKGVD